MPKPLLIKSICKPFYVLQSLIFGVFSLTKYLIMARVSQSINKQQVYERNFLDLFEKKTKELAQKGLLQGVTPSTFQSHFDNAVDTFFLTNKSNKIIKKELSVVQLRVLCLLNCGYSFNGKEIERLLNHTHWFELRESLREVYSMGFVDIDFSGRLKIYSISESGRAEIAAYFARLAELKRKARKIIYKYFPLANRNYKYVTPKKHKEKLETLRGKRSK